MTKSHRPNRWKRYDVWDERPLRLDSFAAEDPEHGFCAANSPYDPRPGLKVEDGRVVEMDGVPESEFDMVDIFIARHHLDLAVTEEAMALDALQAARMLVDISVPREAVVRVAAGMTPAKLAEVLGHLNATELTFANGKLRCRNRPANQAHVTNAKDDPVQMAADAATAAAFGFDEIETTVRVARHARSNAIACAVGAAAARNGTLIQCSVEEAEELRLGMTGFTSYTETMSVYGTEATFVDGDDTPWSKAFLTAAYASRGLKARCTSGSSSELLMGVHERKSMLYLEARCLCLQRAMGVQGTQNGGIDGAPLTASVPGGLWEILAENVLAAWLDLECASGNDTRFTESEIRVGAKIVPHLMSGTDFICSGLGSVQAYDNSFNASLFNGEELEDFLAIQRDYMIDGGLSHVAEEEILAGRQRAIAAIATILEALEVPRLTEVQEESVLLASGSRETDSLSAAAIASLNTNLRDRRITALEVIRILAERGFEAEAERLVMMLRQRVAGDYLQTSAIIRDGRVVSAVNDANDYLGPGSGYRISERRRGEIARMRDELSSTEVLHQETRPSREERRRYTLVAGGTAAKGNDAREVVIGVSPAFGVKIHRTTAGLPLSNVLRRLMAGISEAGGKPRVVRMAHTADTSFLGLSAARLAGSGIGIGIQAKGTTVIHKSDLAPHMNLELFSMAPLITEADYQAIGRNAALYALNHDPEPIVVPYGGEALGARFHVRTALLHALDTEMTEPEAEPRDLEVRFHDA
jgi:propanediol dehydratase large subunit